MVLVIRSNRNREAERMVIWIEQIRRILLVISASKHYEAQVGTTFGVLEPTVERIDHIKENPCGVHRIQWPEGWQ
jgi:hypothetical protein